MKLRHTILLAAITLFLTACTFTLAADVTPPPNYVPPTAQPTMGALYPASAPDIHNGAKIYVEKCLPCHGDTGLGDGEKGKQLPVTVAAIGLPDFAQKASPAAWYTQVTQGNLERFMPPFASLNDQERWDVVGYALFIHMKPEQIDQGKALLESSCADCAKYFSNSEMMSALSENDLIAIMKNGQGDIPAFGKDFSADETAAVAIYLRTQTFAAPSPHGSAATPEAAATLEASTPAAETTPGDGTQISPVETAPAESGVAAGMGNVTGSVENQTGADLPSDAKIILHGYEHEGDPNAGPTEVSTLETAINADGTYLFENVEFPENRIYIAEIIVNGLNYQSEFGLVETGMTELAMPPIVVYAVTDDFSGLKITSMQIFFDFANEGDAQVFTVYSIVNDSDKTVMVNMGEQQTVPFIAFPKGSTQLGYEAAQDSAPFVPTENGFAMPPSQTPYGLIAFASIPKAKEIFISQPALLSIDTVTLLLPEGMEAEGKTLTDDGIQPTQGMNFHIYTSGKVEKDANFEFTLTGEPSAGTAVQPDVTQNTNLLIGVGAFGVVLILIGGWLFIRDRNKTKKDEELNDEEDDEFEDTESIMDAIIAIDDLHRSGKLSDEAYQQKREELKNALKRKS